MPTEITLQELIEKVKTELFSPVTGTDLEGKIAYPLFLVDEVELEINVEISHGGSGGVKIFIPQLVEGNASSEKKHSYGHVMKIKLKPILTTEEMRARIKKDKRISDGVEQASFASLYKGVVLDGDEE